MRAAALAVAVLGLAACEVLFDPIVPTDLRYALSGYLDASADTQWVRVEPFARTIDTDPAPLAATVTLEDLGTGAERLLTQRVRTFRTGPAHLFWTTAEVALGGRYRLHVRDAEGAETTAEVAIPAEDAFAVHVESGPFICPTAVTVTGAERVVDIQARYRFLRDGQVVEARLTHIDAAVRLDPQTVRVTLYPGDDLEQIGLGAGGASQLLTSEVVVGVSTAAWPDVVGVSLEDALQLESVIEGGVGFLGGAVTRRLPFTPGAGTGVFGQGGPCVAP